jgi:hypothetical protein
MAKAFAGNKKDGSTQPEIPAGALIAPAGGLAGSGAGSGCALVMKAS